VCAKKKCGRRIFDFAPKTLIFENSKRTPLDPTKVEKFILTFLALLGVLFLMVVSVS